MKTNYVAVKLIIVFLLTTIGSHIDGFIRPLNEITNDYTEIELKTFANVFITQGDKTEARIEKSSNSSDVLLKVEGNRLIIYSEKNTHNETPVNVYVTVKNLTEVDLEGSGNIKMTDNFKCDNIDLEIAGSGNIDANVDAKSLTVKIDGSGDLDIKGKSNESDISINGSGNMNAKEFKTSTSSIKVSGSGTSTIDVKDELTVKISGSGNVFYLTEPERVHAKSSGSGRVEKIKA